MKKYLLDQDLFEHIGGHETIDTLIEMIDKERVSHESSLLDKTATMASDFQKNEIKDFIMYAITCTPIPQLLTCPSSEEIESLLQTLPQILRSLDISQRSTELFLKRVEACRDAFAKRSGDSDIDPDEKHFVRLRADKSLIPQFAALITEVIITDPHFDYEVTWANRKLHAKALADFLDILLLNRKEIGVFSMIQKAPAFFNHCGNCYDVFTRSFRQVIFYTPNVDLEALTALLYRALAVKEYTVPKTASSRVKTENTETPDIVPTVILSADKKRYSFILPAGNRHERNRSGGSDSRKFSTSSDNRKSMVRESGVSRASSKSMAENPTSVLGDKNNTKSDDRRKSSFSGMSLECSNSDITTVDDVASKPRRMSSFRRTGSFIAGALRLGKSRRSSTGMSSNGNLPPDDSSGTEDVSHTERVASDKDNVDMYLYESLGDDSGFETLLNVYVSGIRRTRELDPFFVELSDSELREQQRCFLLGILGRVDADLGPLYLYTQPEQEDVGLFNDTHFDLIKGLLLEAFRATNAVSIIQDICSDRVDNARRSGRIEQSRIILPALPAVSSKVTSTHDLIQAVLREESFST